MPIGRGSVAAALAAASIFAAGSVKIVPELGTVVAGFSGRIETCALIVWPSREALTITSAGVLEVIEGAIPVAVNVPVSAPQESSTRLDRDAAGPIYRTTVVRQRRPPVPDRPTSAFPAWHWLSD